MTTITHHRKSWAMSPTLLSRLRIFQALTFALIAVSLSGCQTRPTVRKPVYNGKFTYPVTVVPLEQGWELRHIAGKECAPESTFRPEVNGERTESIYELRDNTGTLVGTFPSSLIDPSTDESEFATYHRANDSLAIHVSTTHHTVLVIEDGTTAYPDEVFLLFYKEHDGNWKWGSLDAPRYRPKDAHGGYLQAPRVTSLSDTHIWLQGDGPIEKHLLKNLLK
ncbi:hypothetical protein [Roseimicrobium sp. ORNL1]|uniref:hypothetical protein n=1 Tax=Roseimicrobium sp. ORNL1 TaxID=2711231 RepID=UPI0013E1669E|nr:hypothetical protein [Roseimicrobium sp. ORNL1]QIF01119.1 hypothetical protein G5S37_06165 [Roseimicrobium sp. ORNL1]